MSQSLENFTKYLPKVVSHNIHIAVFFFLVYVNCSFVFFLVNYIFVKSIF